MIESGGFGREAWDIIKWPFIMLVGLLSWNVKRQIARTDQNETDIEDVRQEYVQEKTFNETLKSLRGDIKVGFQDTKESHKEMRQDIKDIHQRINQELKR